MDIEKAKEAYKGLKKNAFIVGIDKVSFINIIESVLNELDNKDKIIKLMAKELTTPVHGVDWVIDYYKKKVEGK